MAKKYLLGLAVIGLLSMRGFAADVAQPAAPTDTAIKGDDPESAKRLAWWSEARFGMFIHWGLYSQDGCFYKGQNGGSEHMMQHLQIPLAEYAKIAYVFNPTKFNADEWVAVAKGAGMKYMVLTSKHHDGFAMFNSPSNDYNIVKAGVWHHDPVKELSEACAKAGMKFGVYYSLGRDWADPDVPTKDGYRSNTWDYPDESKKVFAKYFERKVKPQISELLAQYDPAVIWFDTPEEISAGESKELLDLIHKAKPECIVNSRIGHGLGDYGVSEQKIPGAADAKPWETCMTLNGHWAYFKGDEKWKPATTVVRNLIDIVSKGGNYLLNVGPTGEGVIPQGAVDDLAEVGAWMKVNGEAIYGTTGSSLGKAPAWGRVTEKVEGGETTLYLHIFDWPKDGKLVVDGVKGAVDSATLLADGTKLDGQASGSEITISLPDKAPDAISSTVVVKLK